MASDQLLLNDFINHSKSEEICVNYVKIMRDGKLSAEFNRLQKTRLHIWSVSKGFTSVGIGIARDEGLLSLDERVVDIFPELVPDNPAKHLDEITIKHLLTMTTGVKKEIAFKSDNNRFSDLDHLKLFFDSEFGKPGESWEYSTLSTYVASRVIAKRAGMTLCDYLRPRLFDKLDIRNPSWDTCPKGHSYAGFGLHLTIDELARYSELLRCYGEYESKRVVSREYMEEASSVQADNSIMLQGEKKAFWGYGYGYQFIMNPKGGYRSDGMLGQFAIAIPEKGVTVTVMSLDDRTARVGTLLYEDVVNRISE